MEGPSQSEAMVTTSRQGIWNFASAPGSYARGFKSPHKNKTKDCLQGNLWSVPKTYGKQVELWLWCNTTTPGTFKWLNTTTLLGTKMLEMFNKGSTSFVEGLLGGRPKGPLSTSPHDKETQLAKMLLDCAESHCRTSWILEPSTLDPASKGKISGHLGHDQIYTPGHESEKYP